MPLNVCRFNPEHTFANPVDLRRHYEQDHAGEWQAPPNPKVRCVVNGCGKITHQSNMYSHLKREHHGHTITGSYVEVEQDTPLTPRKYLGKEVNGTAHNVKAQSSKRPRGDDINRCNVCDHVNFRRLMGKHFQRQHRNLYREWLSHVTKLEENEPQPSAELVLAELPETVEHGHTFAMHEDGNGYIVDDFWLPVVHQLSTPAGVIPVEAMAALGAFRDDVGRMLHAVTHLQPARQRRR